jgi:hypothetical protein
MYIDIRNLRIDWPVYFFWERSGLIQDTKINLLVQMSAVPARYIYALLKQKQMTA